MLLKVCSILAVFGAVNWVVLSMWDTDAVRAALGDARTTGTDALKIVVALASLYVLLAAFKSRRD